MDYADLAAQRWFGYGRWDAPYWFIGLEQGGSGPLSYEVWHQLGEGELLDCREHHRLTAEAYTERAQMPNNPDRRQDLDHARLWGKWHLEGNVQRTWYKLILLLLGYMDQPADLESARAYQRSKWGSAGGQTAVVELYGTRAHSLRVDVDRKRYLADRAHRLRERVEEHCPALVVCYGAEKGNFESAIGIAFDANGNGRKGATLCALVPHPNARGESNETQWWVNKGRHLRLGSTR